MPVIKIDKIASKRKFVSVAGRALLHPLQDMMDSLNSRTIPIIGLGTWQAKPAEVEKAILTALDTGYRHIDTAFNYNNEEAIGSAISKWMKSGKGKREELFICTKLPHIGNRASDVSKYLSTSLKRLQLDYLDLYLIHLPFGFKPNESGDAPATNPDGSIVLDETDHIAVWTALEEQVNLGKIREIGLSNFNVKQIERLTSHATIQPSNLQVEMHAYLQQAELRECCAKHGISITAYSPLGSPGAKEHFVTKYNYSPDAFPDLMNHPLVVDLSKQCNKSPAQILLRHLVQQGITVIPKSANPERIKQNFQIFDFELSETAINDLNALDRGENGRIINFLFWKGVEKHPEYPFKKV